MHVHMCIDQRQPQSVQLVLVLQIERGEVF